MTSTEELESQIQAQDCELEYWLQQADNYAEIQIPADDLRAIIARTYAAVNALPELVERVRRLEEALKPFADKAHYWLERDDIHGLDDDDECATEIRFGDFRRARAALNQEPGHE